jgi:hypothetical protein
MNTTTSIKKEIESIKNELLRLDPIHPGSISQQWNICGRPACKCHLAVNPKKHGPYNKLTYARRGKPACRFVRPEHLAEMERRLAAHKTFRKLVDRWIELSIEMGVIEFFSASGTPGKATRKPSAK